jgi:UPF0716 protein FxsA
MRIPFSIPVIFVAFAEIAVFILVGGAIGVVPTLVLTLLSMIAGAVLLKRQGLATLNRIRADVAGGRVPARPMAEAAMVAVAGFLLMVPGFLTGAAGLTLFIPAVRSAIWGRMRRQLEMRVQRRHTFRPPGAAILELEPGEYESPPRPGAAAPDTPWRPRGADRP